MKYAVVNSAGKQYKVSVGDIIEIAKLSSAIDTDYTFPEVVMMVDGQECLIGTPFLLDVIVKGKIIGHTKKKKVRVAKFKAKARYRRVQGHRDQVTKLTIEEIGKKGKTAKEMEK